MSKQKNIDFGRNKPASEFFNAFKKAAASRFWSNRYEKTVDLAEGAIKAFHDGHPLNFQTLLLNHKAFVYRDNEGYALHFVIGKFCDLLEKSADPQADTELAVAKLSSADKKLILDRALGLAIGQSYSYKEEKIIHALLACGADPNAKVDGHPGKMLAAAVSVRSPEVVKALYEHGADLAATRAYMGKHSLVSDITLLKYYEQTLTGAPAAEQAGPAAGDLARLEEKVDGLKALVQELTEAVRGQKSPEAAEKPARQPYPSL